MEAFIKSMIAYLAMGVETIAALFIAAGCVEAIKNVFIRTASQSGYQQARLQLGQWLAFSLEFLLAADILRTAVSPSWNDIGQLAAIATIRTALNHFLEREIVREEARRG